MEIPAYVTIEEVQRVCRALNIRDWTVLSEGRVFQEEAYIILMKQCGCGSAVPL